jgi:hypothetical protein
VVAEAVVPVMLEVPAVVPTQVAVVVVRHRITAETMLVVQEVLELFIYPYQPQTTQVQLLAHQQ